MTYGAQASLPRLGCKLSVACEIRRVCGGTLCPVETASVLTCIVCSDMYAVTCLSRRDGVRRALPIYLTIQIVLDCLVPHCRPSLLPRLPNASLSPLPPTSTALCLTVSTPSYLDCLVPHCLHSLLPHYTTSPKNLTKHTNILVSTG
jgi:hypothetical protein